MFWQHYEWPWHFHSRWLCNKYYSRQRLFCYRKSRQCLCSFFLWSTWRTHWRSRVGDPTEFNYNAPPVWYSFVIKLTEWLFMHWHPYSQNGWQIIKNFHIDNHILKISTGPFSAFTLAYIRAVLVFLTNPVLVSWQTASSILPESQCWIQ